MRHTFFIIITLIANYYSSYSQKNQLLVGQVAFEEKKYQESVISLNTYLLQYPNNQKALFLRACSNLELGNYKSVIQDISLLKSTYHHDILLIWARASVAIGNKEESLRLLGNYLQKPKKQDEKKVLSFKEFQILKDSEQWSALWNKENYSRKERLLNNAKYAIKSGKFAEANDRLNELLSRFSRSHEGHYLKGKLLFSDKKYQLALKSFESAADLKEENLDYLSAIALCNVKLNKFKKAINQFNQILLSDSLYLPAYKGRAEAFLVAKDYENAGKDIAKYRIYYPSDVNARFLNASINVKRGDYLSAISTYGKLIKENPAKAEYFVGRANSYMETKTYKYAIKDYSMALDLDPKNITVYKQKAEAHKLSGDIKKACIEWQHASKLGDVESMENLHKYCK